MAFFDRPIPDGVIVLPRAIQPSSCDSLLAGCILISFLLGTFLSSHRFCLKEGEYSKDIGYFPVGIQEIWFWLFFHCFSRVWNSLRFPFLSVVINLPRVPICDSEYLTKMIVIVIYG